MSKIDQEIANRIALEDPRLTVLWTGKLPCGDWAIVRDADNQRIYSWPGFIAWRGPLPGEPAYQPEPAAMKQTSLF